jgi:surface polysaccharide O-acyltransferase-like enzyme
MTTTNYLELQSRTINFLRFPLMLMVVFIHNQHLEIDMQDVNYFDLSLSDMYSIIVTIGHFTLTAIAVPCFFIISGYLFFYKTTNFSKEIYIGKLKKRIFTLFLPYIIWNILSICVKMLFAIKNGEMNIFEANLYEKGFLSIFWNYSSWLNFVTDQTFYGPGLLPLWYLRDLILTVIITPFIYYFIQRTKLFGIILIGLLYYFQLGFEILNYNLNQLIAAVFFFSVGGYFSLNSKNIILEFRKIKNLSFALSSVFLVLSIYFFQTEIFRFILPIYIIFGIISIFNLTSVLIENKKFKDNDFLSNASFFIYLSHTILILSISRNILDKIIVTNDFLSLSIKYVLTPFICVSFCIFLYWLLSKYFKRFTFYLTGGK